MPNMIPNYEPPALDWETLALISVRLERFVPSAWLGHIPFAFWLVGALRPRRFVELGTHTGAAFCAVLQASEKLGLPTQAIAVDTWVGDVHAGRYDDSVFAELSAYCGDRYGTRAQLLRMTFDEALGHVPDRSVDLLHIDGLHTYEAARHDFESWRPKLTNDAIVLFHDTSVRHKDFGVWRLWAELTAQFHTLSFKHSAGLGVLAMGTDVPASLAALLAKPGGPPPPDARRACEAFETFGTMMTVSASAQHEIDKLRAPAARTPRNVYRLLRRQPLSR